MVTSKITLSTKFIIKNKNHIYLCGITILYLYYTCICSWLSLMMPSNEAFKLFQGHLLVVIQILRNWHLQSEVSASWLPINILFSWIWVTVGLKPHGNHYIWTMEKAPDYIILCPPRRFTGAAVCMEVMGADIWQLSEIASRLCSTSNIVTMTSHWATSQVLKPLGSPWLTIFLSAPERMLVRPLVKQFKVIECDRPLQSIIDNWDHHCCLEIWRQASKHGRLEQSSAWLQPMRPTGANSYYSLQDLEARQSVFPKRWHKRLRRKRRRQAIDRQSFKKRSEPGILQLAVLQYLLQRKMNFSTKSGARRSHTTKPVTLNSNAVSQYPARISPALKSMNPHSIGAKTCNAQPLLKTFWRSSFAMTCAISERTSSSKAAVLPNQMETHCLTISRSHTIVSPVASTWLTWQQKLLTSSKLATSSFFTKTSTEWKYPRKVMAEKPKTAPKANRPVTGTRSSRSRPSKRPR